MPKSRKRKNKRSQRFSELAYRRWSKFSNNSKDMAENQQDCEFGRDEVRNVINNNPPFHGSIDADAGSNVSQVSVTIERA